MVRIVMRGCCLHREDPAAAEHPFWKKLVPQVTKRVVNVLQEQHREDNYRVSGHREAQHPQGALQNGLARAQRICGPRRRGSRLVMVFVHQAEDRPHMNQPVGGITNRSSNVHNEVSW